MDYKNIDQEKEECCKKDMGRGCSFCSCEGEKTALAHEDCYKLHATDWLEGMPERFPDDIFEVRFKNTRKSFFKNVNNLPLKRGDVVAVEASPGHDIGIISMTGDLVARQMKRVGFNPMNGEFKKIYRKAKPFDIEKWQEAIALEHTTMIRSRQIASELGLNMKIGDVEYQGDKIKAIFYYIADERVDFRELIKVFADQFRIRVEMKQIGARQEAGRIGGLGSCGRELCCASWISSFVSVTTNSARHQEISLNPLRLAGQCGKLKCCLIYEVDSYQDARKDFPRVSQPLQAMDGDYYLVKTDILSRTMWFSSDPNHLGGMQPVNVERVKEIIRMNQKGKKVDQLLPETAFKQVEEPTFANAVGEDSLTRFDKQQTSSKRRNGRNRKPNGENNGGSRKESAQGAEASEKKSSEGYSAGSASPEKKRPPRTPRSEQERGGNARRERPKNGGDKRVASETTEGVAKTTESAEKKSQQGGASGREGNSREGGARRNSRRNNGRRPSSKANADGNTPPVNRSDNKE